jgi:hypothetical protein
MKSLVLTISVLVSGLVFGQDWRDNFIWVDLSDDFNQVGAMVPPNAYKRDVFTKTKSKSLYDGPPSMKYFQTSTLDVLNPIMDIDNSLSNMSFEFKSIGYDYVLDSVNLKILDLQEKSMLGEVYEDEVLYVLINDTNYVCFVINKYEFIIEIHEYD